MPVYRIFLTYLKIGCMAFGGGYVMLPLIESEFVNRHEVIEADDVYRLFALAQSLPGIIAVNMAVFLGHKLRGVRGALAAAVGVILPSIVIITVISVFFQSFASIPWVQSVFKGLNIAVLVIIAQALWKIGKRALKDYITVGIFIIILAGYLITGWNSAVFAAAGAFAGLLLAGRGEKNA